MRTCKLSCCWPTWSRSADQDVFQPSRLLNKLSLKPLTGTYSRWSCCSQHVATQSALRLQTGTRPIITRSMRSEVSLSTGPEISWRGNWKANKEDLEVGTGSNWTFQIEYLHITVVPLFYVGVEISHFKVASKVMLTLLRCLWEDSAARGQNNIFKKCIWAQFGFNELTGNH